MKNKFKNLYPFEIIGLLCLTITSITLILNSLNIVDDTNATIALIFYFWLVAIALVLS